MQVMEGASFPTTPEHWRKLEVSVNDEDFVRLCTEWDVSHVSATEAQRFRALANLAQRLLLQRMMALGGVSREEAQTEARRVTAERDKIRAELVQESAG